MSHFKPVPRTAIPTGPTGILDSSRGGKKSGGKRTLGGSRGIVSTPMKKPMGKR